MPGTAVKRAGIGVASGAGMQSPHALVVIPVEISLPKLMLPDESREAMRAYHCSVEPESLAYMASGMPSPFRSIGAYPYCAVTPVLTGGALHPCAPG